MGGQATTNQAQGTSMTPSVDGGTGLLGNAGPAPGNYNHNRPSWMGGRHWGPWSQQHRPLGWAPWQRPAAPPTPMQPDQWQSQWQAPQQQGGQWTSPQGWLSPQGWQPPWMQGG